MEEQVYKRLARKLDELPNGYPATQSGVEIKILQKIFTLEEGLELEPHQSSIGDVYLGQYGLA